MEQKARIKFLNPELLELALQYYNHCSIIGLD